MIDLFLVYQMIRRLATPFKEWDAYKLDIIDEKGNVLRKRKELRTTKERKAFGAYDVMLLNLKKLLEKLPGGSSRLASYAAALYLLREWKHFTPDSLLTEDITDSTIEKSTELFFNGYTDYNTLAENVNGKYRTIDELFEKRFDETVTAGSGAIAGIGVGPQGEPGLTPAQMKRYKKKNKKKTLRDIIGQT